MTLTIELYLDRSFQGWVSRGLSSSFKTAGTQHCVAFTVVINLLCPRTLPGTNFVTWIIYVLCNILKVIVHCQSTSRIRSNFCSRSAKSLTYPTNVDLHQFLANVNSRSRSLYAVARPSVVCLRNARAPYSGGCNFFRQYFYGIWYLGHPSTRIENFMEVSHGNPSVGGVKPKRGSKI